MRIETLWLDTLFETHHDSWETKMTNYNQVYINGKWVAPSSTDTIEVWDSTDESVMASIPSCTTTDVDLAAQAARAAFDSWSSLDAQERG